MNKTIVRIQEVELINFKNVKKGIINFPSYKKKSYYDNESEILGLYGQNGSGKTALVDAFGVIRNLIKGESLPKDINNYIFQTENNASLKFTFYIERDSEKKLVFYEVNLKKDENEIAYISKENIAFKQFENDTWSSKKSIIKYNAENKEMIFQPKEIYKKIVQNNNENKAEVMAIEYLVKKENKSFIFHELFLDIISGNLQEYDKIFESLLFYFRNNLIIIKNNHTGIINENIVLPIIFKIENKMKLTLNVNMLEPEIVPKFIFKTLEILIKHMNYVLENIIPGLNVQLRQYGKASLKDGSEGIRFELMSKKGDICIPLRYESDGIKKIISILTAMIAVYNQPSVCMVIDELDSGIYEYLLGEILQILDEGGQGQLIFTSHNLRALEKLNTNSVIFTTTNEENRYVRFKNIGKGNNLRDKYYRAIELGGQTENLYEETNSFDINYAFRSAGRFLSEE